MLIETGKGAFRIKSVFAVSDRTVMTDSQNRVLVFGPDGALQGRLFGSKATAHAGSNLLCVENEKGQLALYALGPLEKRRDFSFTSPIAWVQFDTAGKQLFVLTADQTIFVIDLNAPETRVAGDASAKN